MLPGFLISKTSKFKLLQSVKGMKSGRRGKVSRIHVAYIFYRFIKNNYAKFGSDQSKGSVDKEYTDRLSIFYICRYLIIISLCYLSLQFTNMCRLARNTFVTEHVLVAK